MSLTIENYLNKIANTFDRDLTSCGFERITVGASLSKLTIPDGAKYARAVIDSTAVGVAARILDGNHTTVTASVGIPVLAGGVFNIIGTNSLAGFQIIKDQAGTTYLNCEYYK